MIGGKDFDAYLLSRKTMTLKTTEWRDSEQQQQHRDEIKRERNVLTVVPIWHK